MQATTLTSNSPSISITSHGKSNKSTLNTQDFAVFDGKAKNMFTAVFIVLWPCLLTTKLRSVIRHNLGHSMQGASQDFAS